jgi:hypothetical protein
VSDRREQVCGNCRFFDPASGRELGGGCCRRHAPRPALGPGDPDAGATDAYWPVVLDSEWCGEWAPHPPVSRAEPGPGAGPGRPAQAP